MSVFRKSSALTLLFMALSFLISIQFVTGKRIYDVSDIIKVYTNIGPKMCAERCSKYFDCGSFVFKRSSLYCELIKPAPSIQFIDDESFTYTDISSIFRSEDNICWPNPCSSGQMCTMPTKGKHVCLDIDTHFTSTEKSFITAERELQNVAIGKIASQHPDDIDEYEGLYRPNDAIDGNIENMAHTTFYNESLHDGIYWIVDLLTNFLVRKVEIFNRISECCSHRMQDMDVTVGLKREEQVLCGHFDGPGTSGQHIVINCPEIFLGRYVKLELLNPNVNRALNVAEVKVFAFV